MTKWIVGLLLANLALFGWMRWGSALTVDVNEAAMQAALNPDKIKLLPLQAATASASSPVAASGVPLALSPLIAASAPVAPAPAVSSPVPASAVAPVSSREASCAEWGEFSGDDLARAQQALSAMKLGEKLSARSVEHNHGYWVYIPPAKKRADVEKKIVQLKGHGVSDYFVVQEKGKWLNAISLGVFKTREAAQRYLATLRSKGIRTAKVGERASRLRFTVFAMKGLDAGTTAKLKSLQKSFPDSELKVLACGN